MDPSAPTPDHLALDDLDDECNPSGEDAHDDGDNYGDDLQDDAPVAEPDPIEAAIARDAAPQEALRLICGALARQAALMEWIHLHPQVYSMSRQLDIARAVGRRQRILAGLAQLILTEMREGEEPDPDPRTVERLLGLLRDEVIRVLREVATPEQAALFEARLAEKMAV
jgi:hypothetical protein